jgi:hypothetical protein
VKSVARELAGHILDLEGGCEISWETSSNELGQIH